jgi:hypothetical protein
MEDILDVCFEGLSVHTVTMDLVEHLLLDMPLEPAEAIDFGVDTNEHYRALQWMVQDACRGWENVEDEEGYGLILYGLCSIIVELDRARNDSAKLNALLRTYVPTFEDLIRFQTTRDLLLGRSDKPAKPEKRLAPATRR